MLKNESPYVSVLWKWSTKAVLLIAAMEFFNNSNYKKRNEI
ncbi:hypothetical protein LEP1GSC021_4604 [Leptospira noguchii str. 1993005606]|nr:hypothetical protein LEP1GSC021_4604 [Leptospira noguchii str. 1993005606]